MLGEQPREMPRANTNPSGKSFDAGVVAIERSVSDETGGAFCGGDAPAPCWTERGGFRSASKARTKPGCFGGSRSREKPNISSQCWPDRADGTAIDARGSDSAEKQTVVSRIAAHPGSFAFGMVEHGKPLLVLTPSDEGAPPVESESSEQRIGPHATWDGKWSPAHRWKMADAQALDDCMKVRRGSTRAIVLLSMGLVANLAALMTFAATLSEIAADWSLDASQSGWIGGIYFAGYAIAVPFLASASDRMDARRLYVVSALLGAAASLAFALFAHGFVLAMILRLLGGIGLAGVHMPGLNLLMDRVDRSVQGRAAGIYTSSYAAGSAGSFLIAGLVDAVFGWRATFIVAGIGPLLSICALGLLPAASSRRSFDKRPPPFRALLRNRALVSYVTAFAGNTWEVFAVRVWFVAYLGWVLHLPGNQFSLPPLGLVSGAASLAGVPASMVMAEIAARRGRRPVVIGICLASVATCLALSATAGGSIWVVLPLLVLVQITSFADVGALAGGAVAAADPVQRGAALALYALGGFTTGFLGPVAVGNVLDWFGGAASAAGWSAGYLVISLGSGVAAWAVWRAPE
jgi:MFS family permease